MIKSFCAIFLLFSVSSLLHAQAVPAAERKGDLTVGAGLVLSDPDYAPHNKVGYSLFGDYVFLEHFGGEFQFKQLPGAGSSSVSERTYEVGGRLLWTIRRKAPYAGGQSITPFIKFDVGAGNFSFQNSYQNGTYGLFAGGGGVEYNVTRALDVRAEYEYQRWSNFPPRGLQPNLVTVGVGYRIRNLRTLGRRGGGQ